MLINVLDTIDDDGCKLRYASDGKGNNYNEKVVVHRIYKEVKTDKELIIYTKGDANSNIEEYKITKDIIISIVNKKIPWIAYPTVMINEIW